MIMDAIQAEVDVISTSVAPLVKDHSDDDIDWPWISEYPIQ